MGKLLSDAVLDAGLNLVRNNVNQMVVCSAQPTTYAEANATFRMASTAMLPGDFTLGNGVTSGRRIIVSAKNDVAVTTGGTANHVALIDTVGLVLYGVTTAPSQAISTPGQVDIASFDIEIADPV